MSPVVQYRGLSRGTPSAQVVRAAFLRGRRYHGVIKLVPQDLYLHKSVALSNSADVTRQHAECETSAASQRACHFPAAGE